MCTQDSPLRQAADLFKSISDVRRLEIVSALAKSPQRVMQLSEVLSREKSALIPQSGL